MATTSYYLYHTLGLTSYHHEKTEFREGAVYYHVSKKKEARRALCQPHEIINPLDGGSGVSS